MNAAAQIDEALAKRQATAQARAALVGAVLTPTHDDRGRAAWILSRWAVCREFGDLTDVEKVLDVMGAPA